MKHLVHVSRNEKGIALIIALLALLVLSTLGSAIIFETQTEIWTSTNFRLLTQARYTAEAGVQQATNWLLYTYTAPSSLTGFDTTKSPVEYNGSAVALSAMDGVTGNYPDGNVQTAFSSALQNASLSGMGVNASYAVTATLISMQLVTPAFTGGGQQALQTWRITSTGNISGTRPAQVQVVATIAKSGSPIFTYAAFGVSNTCDSVKFSGGGSSDSFDSSQGSYATTQQNSEGNVGSNGNISLSGGGVVYGSAATPYSTQGNCNTGSVTGLTLNGGATVTGGMVALSSTVSYSNPSPPNPTPPTGTQNIRNDCTSIAGCTVNGDGSFTLAPGTYADVTVTGGKTLHVSAGTYNLNSISLSGGATLLIDSGPVILNLAGAALGSGGSAADFSGGTVSNPNGTPSNLQIVYAGSNAVKLSGGAASYALIYAPNAPINISGGGNLYGAIIGNTVANSGGTSVHYDRSLPNNFYTVGGYNFISFSWSKY